jgi:hypothetical protein
MKYTLHINKESIFATNKVTPAIDMMITQFDKSQLSWDDYFSKNEVTVINDVTGKVVWKKNEDNLITKK